MAHGGPATPGHDPIWTAIGSLLAVLATAIAAIWRDLRVRRREKKAEAAGTQQRAEQYRDIAWDQASQVRLEYIKLLEQAQEREKQARSELQDRERTIFQQEDEIADMKVKQATRTARHNALIRRLLADGHQGEDLQLWPEPNGSPKQDGGKPQ